MQNQTIACSLHTCVITSEGRVVCWGDNEHGQCDVPPDLENVVSVSCNQTYSAALTAEGRLVCLGDEASRALL